MGMAPARSDIILWNQAGWCLPGLYETLSPHVDELVVAGIMQSRGPKSDKRDAYGLAEKLRVGNLDKSVFKAPRQFTRLREFSRIHMTLVGDVVRVQSRIKSLDRSRGILVSGASQAEREKGRQRALGKRGRGSRRGRARPRIRETCPPRRRRPEPGPCA